VDELALEARGDGFELEVGGTRSDNGNFMLRRSDLTVFPTVERNRDASDADANRARDPNRAVQVAASAALL
jgi:hypothetical protein